MDKRVIRTKAAIRAAYFELLTGDKEVRMSVTEITRRAHIDRKTFYLHYNTVEDIPKEYLDSCVDELCANLREAKWIENPTCFELVFSAANRLIENNREYLSELAHIDDGKYFWIRLRTRIIDIVISRYAAASKMTAAEFGCYVSYNVSGILRLYVSYLRGESGVTLDTVSRISSDIVRNGINVIC